MALFYCASHTQQKLVSRWGVGKHITDTIKYDYITLQQSMMTLQ